MTALMPCCCPWYARCGCRCSRRLRTYVCGRTRDRTGGRTPGRCGRRKLRWCLLSRRRKEGGRRCAGRAVGEEVAADCCCGWVHCRLRSSSAGGGSRSHCGLAWCRMGRRRLGVDSIWNCLGNHCELTRWKRVTCVFQVSLPSWSFFPAYHTCQHGEQQINL
jgi:hypothetical protein